MGLGKSKLYIPPPPTEERLATVAKLPGSLDELRQVLGDRLYLPSDPLFHNARYGIPADGHNWKETFNLDALGLPAAIASCKSVEDVQACVRYAALNLVNHEKIRIAVAAGRHSHMCMVDDAFVIDLGLMKNVSVDSEKRLAFVDAGCLWGEVDSACEPFNLAVTAGHNATTGVAGLTLQGGHGFLERKLGLTVDNLEELDIVTPDGTFHQGVNATTNPDLYWALRGGCGNFGVVTK
eukprot:Colp12_sorted_trinity150504_noHs@5022